MYSRLSWIRTKEDNFSFWIGSMAVHTIRTCELFVFLFLQHIYLNFQHVIWRKCMCNFFLFFYNFFFFLKILRFLQVTARKTWHYLNETYTFIQKIVCWILNFFHSEKVNQLTKSVVLNQCRSEFYNGFRESWVISNLIVVHRSKDQEEKKLHLNKFN